MSNGQHQFFSYHDYFISVQLILIMDILTLCYTWSKCKSWTGLIKKLIEKWIFFFLIKFRSIHFIGDSV